MILDAVGPTWAKSSLQLLCLRPKCTRLATCGLFQVDRRGLIIYIPVSIFSLYMARIDILDTVSTDVKRSHFTCYIYYRIKTD